MTTPLDWSRFEALTFDCYGTLIDWERGIVGAVTEVLTARGIELAPERILEWFAEIESPIQQGPYRSYRAILDLTMERLARRIGFEPTPAEVGALSASLPAWPPFPDSTAALARLAKRYRLGVISNVDDDLFQGSAAQLGAPFAWVVTAQQVGSYKPSVVNFERALDRIGLPIDRILHVAQSRYHDIGPASSLGFATVWVNRRGSRPGTGATMPSDATPDTIVPDLGTLADLVERI